MEEENELKKNQENPGNFSKLNIQKQKTTKNNKKQQKNNKKIEKIF